MPKAKKRNPVVAGLLSLVSPGLGFLYLGKLSYAITYSLAGLLVFAVACWTKVVFAPLGFLIVALALVVWPITAIVLAVLMARRQGEVTLSNWQRWYVYLGFYVVTSAGMSVVMANRSPLFGYDSFHFPSGAMADTLKMGDYFLSDTWKYGAIAPQRGELIVFRFPGNPAIKYVKRVIGLPGDTVEMRNGTIYINGQRLDEPYVKSENNERTSQMSATYQVPKDGYFVLGDNRDHSSDSRFWGPVPKENLYGSVEFIWLSIDPSSGIRTDRIGRIVK